MSKIINYLMLFSGISILFYFAGITHGTVNTTLLDMALNPANLQNTDLFVVILSVSTAVLAVVSTFIVRSQNSDFYLFIPLTMAMFGFGWDFLSVYNTLNAETGVGAALAALIFGPLMIGYVFAVVEWWRGTST